MLRISMLWAAALAAALCWFPGAAFGQYTPAKVTTSPNFNSYYAQQPKENDYLTSNNEYQAPPAEAGAACDSGCWDECCCDRFGTWRDNTILSIGAEAYKSLGDSTQPPGPATDYMASAGFVGTFNTGFQLIEDSPIRGQVGASYGVYDLNGRDTSSVGSPEQQTFFTLGLSKRSDVLNDDRLAWGLVYDQFWAHQWGLFASELYTGQVRGLLGWAVNERDELGVWGAFRATGDNSVAGISPPPVRAMNQYNVFWRHNYDFGGQTMLWLGGNDPADVGSWLLGAMGQAPLNDYVSLYGNFTLDFAHSGSGIVGSNQQEWAFGLGLAYSLGGKAWSPSVSGRQGLPLMPVANNGSMLMTN
jgi:Family of unknown function (DUF6666)